MQVWLIPESKGQGQDDFRSAEAHKEHPGGHPGPSTVPTGPDIMAETQAQPKGEDAHNSHGQRGQGRKSGHQSQIGHNLSG